MGYDVGGFVFTEEPNWSAFDKLPKELGVTGYRYKTDAIWLLDVWECQAGSRWPMTGWLPVKLFEHRNYHWKQRLYFDNSMQLHLSWKMKIRSMAVPRLAGARWFQFLLESKHSSTPAMTKR